MSFKNYLLSTGKSTASVDLNLRISYDFINWCEDHHIEAQLATYNELLSYMQHLQKRGVSQRTIQLMLGCLKHYFSWLIAAGVRDTLPTEGIAVKNVRRSFLCHILSMPELEKIYGQLGETGEVPKELYPAGKRQGWFSHKTQKVVYGLMLWQGMDTGELSRLAVTDVKLREGTVYIAATRRSNERTLKLESVQIMDLVEYLHAVRPEYLRTNPESDKLFIGRGGGQWGKNFMTCLLQSVRAINPQVTTLKQLRASVIVHWIKSSNLRQAQHMAGHRYVSSTEAYLVNDLDDLQEDITKFHPMS